MVAGLVIEDVLERDENTNVDGSWGIFLYINATKQRTEASSPRHMALQAGLCGIADRVVTLTYILTLVAIVWHTAATTPKDHSRQGL
jgi:hypothetical protein